MLDFAAVMEDENNHDGVEPLLEMSQDCVVEWNDESQEQVAALSITPLDRTGQRRGSTSSRSPPGSSLGLDKVRRRLEDSNEIDAIVNLLQPAQQVSDSPNRAVTQKTGHPNSHQAEASAPAAARSLVSRRRRRQRDSEESNKRRQHVEPPVLTPPPPASNIHKTPGATVKGFVRVVVDG